MCIDHGMERLAKACLTLFAVPIDSRHDVQCLPKPEVKHIFENIFLGREIIIQARRLNTGGGADLLERGGGVAFFPELPRCSRKEQFTGFYRSAASAFFPAPSFLHQHTCTGKKSG